MQLNTSVIIISYNSEKFLNQNLNSLLHQTVPFAQIIVVDNHSTDSSVNIISEFKGIETIFLTKNCGYAGGANMGIDKTNTDLVLIANSDIILEETFNEKIIAKFSKDAQLAMVSPLIKRFDKKTVDSAGQTYSWALFPKEIGYNKPVTSISTRERPVFSVCGAATVIRREAIEKLKISNQFYDNDYFIFWEDFDIGWRASQLGLKILFYPEAIAYHFRSGTLKKNILSRFSLSIGRSADIKYHLIKNRYLTLIKNFNFKRFWWAIPFIFFKDLIWVLTLSAPKIIIKFMVLPKYFRRAFHKRRSLQKNPAK